MQQIVSTQIQSRCQRAWQFAPPGLAKELRRLKVSQPNLVQLVTDEYDLYGAPTRDFALRVLYLVWCLFDERVELDLVAHSTPSASMNGPLTCYLA